MIHSEAGVQLLSNTLKDSYYCAYQVILDFFSPYVLSCVKVNAHLIS